MRKIILLLLATFTFAFTLNVWAESMDQSSGCGMGWYLFKKNSLVSSTFRNTTNEIFSNQTFGMTFGTSNCAKHDIVKKDKQDIYFAESNQEVLALEMAEGKGEYLNAFARTLGCSDGVVGDFSKEVQTNYQKIYDSNSTSPKQMLKNVKDVIRVNNNLSKNCAII